MLHKCRAPAEFWKWEEDTATLRMISMQFDFKKPRQQQFQCNLMRVKLTTIIYCIPSPSLWHNKHLFFKIQKDLEHLSFEEHTSYHIVSKPEEIYYILCLQQLFIPASVRRHSWVDVFQDADAVLHIFVGPLVCKMH